MGSYDRIANDILPNWMEHFKRKNADYSSPRAGTGDLEVEPHTVLGTAGQFADIWRKVWKLKKALWDGEKLSGEQPEEILFDLIAHCFLTLDLLYAKEFKFVDQALLSPQCGSSVAGMGSGTCDRIQGHQGPHMTTPGVKNGKA